MSVYRPKHKDGAYKSEFFHYDFQIKLPTGERRRFHGSTGQRTKASAKKVEDKLRELAATGKLNIELTMDAAAWRFHQEVSIHQPSGGNTEKSLEHLCRLVGGDLPLISLDAEKIADAARQRAGEVMRRKGGREVGVKNATVNRQIVEMARRLLRRAKRIWRVPVEIDLPWGDLKLPEPSERVRIIASDERATLSAQTRVDYAPILKVYQITGVRKAGLCGLKKSAVDWERDGFSILLKRRRGEEPRPHFYPFTDELRTIFREEIAKSPLPVVFTYIAQRGAKKGLRQAITYNGLRRVWDNAREGLTDLRFHDQRHDAATAMLRSTGNLALAGKLLGHADLSSTQRYAHVMDDDLRSGMERVEAARKRASEGGRRPKSAKAPQAGRKASD